MALSCIREWFRLDIRKKFLRVVLHWHRLSKKVFESLSPEVFEKCGCSTAGHG